MCIVAKFRRPNFPAELRGPVIKEYEIKENLKTKSDLDMIICKFQILIS